MSGLVVGATNTRTISDKLNYLLDKGHAKDAYVQWGLVKRNVIIIKGKKYQYKKGKIFSLLQNKIIHALYSSASESLNTNTETDVMGKAGKVKTRHVVQIVYEITIVIDGSAVFHRVSKTVVVFGGRAEIHEAIFKKYEIYGRGRRRRRSICRRR